MGDPDDELAAIRRMMDDAQRTTEDNGKYFVLWGLLTTVGLAATYVSVMRGSPVRPLWVAWAVLVALGWFVATRWARLDHARAPVRTVARTLVAESWAGIGLAMTVLVFAGATAGTISPLAVPGMLSALMGAGTFAGASVYRQLPLRGMAVVWWAGAIAMLLRPGVYTILLMAALVLGLFVAPGVVLWTRARADGRGARSSPA